MPADHKTQPAIAFDFDGTLVDSAPGILTGMKLALEKNGISPCIPLNAGIIGPPLKQTLALLSGSQNDSLLTQLVTDFKDCYDKGGYRDTAPYPGIAEVLASLAHKGYRLYLATNKRAIPTRLILDHLGWSSFFSAVYCLDEHLDCADKSQMLTKLLQAHFLAGCETPYIGDTSSDAQAAANNHMPYIHVTWGYGALPTENTSSCATAKQLVTQLEQARWN